jgi:hypothetical protein
MREKDAVWQQCVELRQRAERVRADSHKAWTLVASAVAQPHPTAPVGDDRLPPAAARAAVPPLNFGVLAQPHGPTPASPREVPLGAATSGAAAAEEALDTGGLERWLEKNPVPLSPNALSARLAVGSSSDAASSSSTSSSSTSSSSSAAEAAMSTHAVPQRAVPPAAAVEENTRLRSIIADMAGELERIKVCFLDGKFASQTKRQCFTCSARGIIRSFLLFLLFQFSHASFFFPNRDVPPFPSSSNLPLLSFSFFFFSITFLSVILPSLSLSHTHTPSLFFFRAPRSVLFIR